MKKIKQQGFALVEVMVTSTIIAISVIGLAATQIRSLQFNHQAQLLSDSSIVASSILERMRLFPSAVRRNEFNIHYQTLSEFSPANSTQRELIPIFNVLAQSHPNPQFSIECASSPLNQCEICIRWMHNNLPVLKNSPDSDRFHVMCSGPVIM